MRRRGPERVFTPRAHRGASADRRHGRRVHRQRGGAGARAARAEGLGAGAARSCSAAASSGCSAPTCRRSYGGVGLDKVSSDHRRRGRRPRRFVRDDVRRADRPRDHAACSASAPRNRSSATCPAGERGADRRLRAERVGLGLRRARRQARATRQPDGSFLLNGEKMWITNGGFADLFIVFAKVDGEQFTAFIVERAFPGVTSGKEEHKIGSARVVDDAADPAGCDRCRPKTSSGEIGKGHKVAFNVLNYGRFKLGAMCSGGARAVIAEAATIRRPAVSSSASRSPASARSGTSSPKWPSAPLRGRVDALSHRRADRRQRCEAATRTRRRAGGARGVRDRSVDPEGGEQRDARLRGRRERADSRRQRLRARLPGRAPLPRRARQPHLRRHQRDQPAADPGHAGAARASRAVSR